MPEINDDSSKIKLILEEEETPVPLGTDETKSPGKLDKSPGKDDKSPKQNQKKPSTNWNDLTDEQKMMCIETMNFETKSNVAMTSKAEKALVDSMDPITWNTVTLKLVSRFSGGSIQLIANSDNWRIVKNAEFDCQRNYTSSMSHLIDAFLFVFKKGNVQQFAVCDTGLYSDPPDLLKMFRVHAPFKFSEFCMDGCLSSISKFFIQNCESPPDRIHIDGIIEDRELVTRGSITDLYGKNYGGLAKAFKMGYARHLQCMLFSFNPYVVRKVLRDVVKCWVDNEAPIGTRMITPCNYYVNLFFVDEVKQIIDESKDNTTSFLIRKDDDDVPEKAKQPKTILIREESVNEEFYLSFVVIPTALDSSEYENAQDWIWKPHEIR